MDYEIEDKRKEKNQVKNEKKGEIKKKQDILLKLKRIINLLIIQSIWRVLHVT